MRIAYLARNDGTDTRVSKECNSLLEAGHDVTFVGWRKDPQAEYPDPMPRVRKVFNDRAATGDAFRTIAGYRRHAIRALGRLRPEVVHAANEDLAFLCLTSKIGRSSLTVCDIFDSIALKWGDAKFPVNVISTAIAGYVQRNSDAVIVTDEERRTRLDSKARNIVVVQNFPVDAGKDLVDAYPSDSGSLRLYVAGTLYRQRGLDNLLRLATERSDIEIVSAGWIYDALAEDFIKHPSVRYHGVITPDESLRLAASCHAIVALYEPSSTNNVLASPNKVYDALCVGRPVLINSETGIAGWIAERELGFTLPYFDFARLESAISELKVWWQDPSTNVNRLRAIFETGYSWSVAEKNLLDLYGGLSERS